MDGIMVHYGVGCHQFYLELSPQLTLHLSQAIEWQYISQVVLILSTTFTKVSICFFLLRIFGTKRTWKIGLYGIMAFSVVTNVSSASICAGAVFAGPETLGSANARHLLGSRYRNLYR